MPAILTRGISGGLRKEVVLLDMHRRASRGGAGSGARLSLGRHVNPRYFGVELLDGGICENSPPGVRVVPFADFSRGAPAYVSNPMRARPNALKPCAGPRPGSASASAATTASTSPTGAPPGVAVSYQVIGFFQAMARLVFAAVGLFLAVSLAEPPSPSRPGRIAHRKPLPDPLRWPSGLLVRLRGEDPAEEFFLGAGVKFAV